MIIGVQSALLAAAIALSPIVPAQNAAMDECVSVHGLQTRLGSGSAIIFDNGIFIRKEQGPSSGGGALEDWLVEGENRIRIEYSGDDAEFAITQGCRGAMPDEEFVAEASFDAPGTETLTFVHDRPVVAEYLGAEIAGEEGLAIAIPRFREAALARDIDIIFAIQAPLFRDVERRGHSAETAREFAREVILNGEVAAAESFTVTPNSRRARLSGSRCQMQSPMRVVYKTDDGTYGWSSGTCWARFDGGWRVVGP